MRLFADLGIEVHRVVRGATDVHVRLRTFTAFLQKK
jgi:hypothetical protein